MNINIIAAGKLKEKYHKEAFKEYEKRLSAYCPFSLIEVQAEQITDEALSGKYKEIEAQRILNALKHGSYVITLEIQGAKLSSEQFAAKIKEIQNEGVNNISFIIGSANGLSPKISGIADFKLSLSSMTFTHQTAVILLAEQIYRAFKINSNEPYHR